VLPDLKTARSLGHFKPPSVLVGPT